MAFGTFDHDIVFGTHPAGWGESTREKASVERFTHPSDDLGHSVERCTHQAMMLLFLGNFFSEKQWQVFQRRPREGAGWADPILLKSVSNTDQGASLPLWWIDYTTEA